MIGEFSAPDTDCVNIGNLPTGIGMTSDHPLAARQSVRLADLAPCPILWSEGFDSFNRSIFNVYAERVIPSPIMRVAEDGTLSPADAYLALERQLGSALKVATLLRGK